VLGACAGGGAVHKVRSGGVGGMLDESGSESGTCACRLICRGTQQCRLLSPSNPVQSLQPAAHGWHCAMQWQLPVGSSLTWSALACRQP
jgi:hypothetical protein